MEAPVYIRQAEVRDAPIVVELVQNLLLELGGFQTFDTPTTISLCEQLLSTTHFTAFLAESLDSSHLGLLTLAEVPALYVSGRLGWIQELYVSPSARSLGVGQQLVSAAIQYGQSRHWSRLETRPMLMRGRAPSPSIAKRALLVVRIIYGSFSDL